MISAVVLAAGTSSRFGRTKQVVEVDGKPLVQHAVDAAVAGRVDEVVVVLGHEADRVRDALRLPANGRAVVNPRYPEGQAGSLAIGLGAVDASSDGVVVLMADQPGIEGRHVRTLLEAFAAQPAPIVRLRFRDGPGPALLSREVWDRARTLTGDVGARQLMESDPGLLREVLVDEAAPPDIDTSEDLRSDPS